MHVHRATPQSHITDVEKASAQSKANETCKKTTREHTQQCSRSAFLCVSCFVPIMQFCESITLWRILSQAYYLAGGTYSFISMELYRCFRRRSVFVLLENCVVDVWVFFWGGNQTARFSFATHTRLLKL
jgi:hypothetical protein